MKTMCVVFALVLVAGVALAADWQPVPLADMDLDPADVANWRDYREAESEAIRTPQGEAGLRVRVTDERYGGLAITTTPRGGLGNRVRVTLSYRIVEGGPITVWAGPNQWNQIAGVLGSDRWETAVMEVGLLSDVPLVLHIVQAAPGGRFELGGLKIEARGATDQVRHDLGPVDVAVHCDAPSDPAAAYQLGEGAALQWLEDEAEGRVMRLSLAGGAELRQGIGTLPAGTRISLQCRARAGEGAARLGIRRGGEVLAATDPVTADWADAGLEHMLVADASPHWFVAAERAAAIELTRPQVLVTLPDPLGPGVVEMSGERGPITFATGDAKTIYIDPPWEEIRRFKCHLEYNSRWSYRFPDTHEFTLAEDDSEMSVRWAFEGDPVGYTVSMKAEGPDSLLVRVDLRNGGAEAIASFQPGFCLQVSGAWSPRTHIYTMMPRDGQPFPLSRGTPLSPGPDLWPGLGWIRADYVGSPAYQERVAQGEAWEPTPRHIAEVSDFPLLARRIPGRDAWIAWLWPTAAGYMGNTYSPCMHMDPVLGECPAGESRAIFGRMIFFEGTWEELYTRAQAERPELAAMSGMEIEEE